MNHSLGCPNCHSILESDNPNNYGIFYFIIHIIINLVNFFCIYLVILLLFFKCSNIIYDNFIIFKKIYIIDNTMDVDMDPEMTIPAKSNQKKKLQRRYKN
jgi:hypothetical protein